MSKSHMFIGAGAVIVAIFGSLFFMGRPGSTTDLQSREVMEAAIDIVKAEKPTPPQSSRYYAVVATEYYNARYVRGGEYAYSTATLLSLLDEVKKNDPQDIATGTRPVGAPYWDSPKAPFSPNAGKGKRFILDDSFTSAPPPPPQYGSPEFLAGLQAVKDASLARTAEQSAAINFWGGVPGTEAPAGIWQNRLYDVTKSYGLNDKEYAYAQMILAQSVADAFMECWKVKFTYWTKRPDMTDKTIQTAMPNPPFPSYASGHSTISFTAATVLARMFPKDAELFLANAEEAKNSRLWAGIHFPYDNEEGKKHGIVIGEWIIAKLSLQPVGE